MSNFKDLKKTLGRWFSWPWYPIAFSAYPVLGLLAQNIGEVRLSAAGRPLLMSLGLASILFLGLSLVLGNQERAAFLSILWLALVFFYGHVYLLVIGRWKDFDSTPWLFVAWLALAVLAVVWAVKKSPAPQVLNLMVLGLVITSLWQISAGSRWGGARRLAAENSPVQDLVRPQNPPDIYYFILDMYTRDDLLKSAYGYDNSNFLNELKARGFYVARCSQSNYTRTELSVASSLNMAYIQELDPAFANPRNKQRGRLWDAFKHSAVRYNLDQLGYQTVSFATGFAWSELEDADVFLTPPSSPALSEFETLFLQTTLARIGQDLGGLDLDQSYGQNFRNRHQLVFDSMQKVANMPGPQFVYVHLILPHPPFVFGPDGEYTNPADFWNEQKKYPTDQFKIGYINQIIFLNTQLLELIDTILSESETPVIILLQGDHGPWFESNPEHFFILNAYYLPGHTDQLYPHISPVNSFRLIFNNYFGGKYDMLPDVTYYSPVPNLYDFSEVKNSCL
ncbi:MAG TPA: hypothetical protein VFR47_33235 [Anaerolineales bacterium]|nr:hypothetical protein [Anaerolineales bacterium]